MFMSISLKLSVRNGGARPDPFVVATARSQPSALSSGEHLRATNGQLGFEGARPMKICLSCEQRHNQEDWSCPACRRQPVQRGGIPLVRTASFGR